MKKHPSDEELMRTYGPYISAVEAVSSWTEENHGDEFDAEKVMDNVKRNYSSLQDKMDRAIDAVRR